VFTDEHPNNRMNTDHEKDLEKLQCFESKQFFLMDTDMMDHIIFVPRKISALLDR